MWKEGRKEGRKEGGRARKEGEGEEGERGEGKEGGREKGREGARGEGEGWEKKEGGGLGGTGSVFCVCVKREHTLCSITLKLIQPLFLLSASVFNRISIRTLSITPAVSSH